MNKRYILLIGLFLAAIQAFSQMYILNEDFNGASGTTPPAGWNNTVIIGAASDKWHFDNPGNRIINYPIIDPFAIFDSDSTSANGQPEEVALETPVFDASISNYILLHFAQTFDPGSGGTAKIEAFDGTGWFEVVTYSAATSNPSIEMVDLSAITGGVTNARLRFIWSGNGSGFWAIDNIRIYASLPLDGGVVSLDSPVSPVVPGSHNVEITLGNFGYNAITSTRIDWTANGVAQATYNWNGGAIGFGQTQSGVVIGTYNFQDPVLLKIWQSHPNGGVDLNPYNDTITKYLVSPLCGTYTIGGINPDFDSFSQVADVLNTAGITCPVTFLVRNGVYRTEFLLRNIQGTSAVNTITFQSESGDSTLAVLQIIPSALTNETMIYLDGSQFVNFRELGLFTGSTSNNSNNALLLDGAKNIKIERCYFETRKQKDFGIEIIGGSQDIGIDQNRFESISLQASAINISDAQTSGISITRNTIKGASDWGRSTIQIDSLSRDISLSDNFIERCYRAIHLLGSKNIQMRNNVINNSNYGVYLQYSCSDIEISGNRLINIKNHTNDEDGTCGIKVNNATEIDLYNNYIHTTGDGPVLGISLEQVTSSRVNFNSINITSDDTQGKGNGLKLVSCTGVTVKNNILNVLHSGAPVYIGLGNVQLDFDYNDYYGPNQIIGYYNQVIYTDLPAWIAALGMDSHTLTVIPFFTSLTDLSINQVLLKNAGTPINGIEYDIDSTFRDVANPAIGAKEYLLCNIDAGLNAVISPGNPLNGGIQNVSVLLQNQGVNPLTGVSINWMVNNEVQPSYPWSGNLDQGAGIAVNIGSYDFQPAVLYTIKAWTTNPNGVTDCNPKNDTIYSRDLAAPLCGTYTIGGTNPDFITVDDAVTLLNLAGITCPVTLALRDGSYNEQLFIKEIPGTSDLNTITFRSESGDSTKAVLKINPAALKFESLLYLDGTQHIIFENLGFITASTAGSSNNAILLNGARNIEIKGCYFEPKKESDLSLMIQGGSQLIDIKNNRFECINYKVAAIKLTDSQTRQVNIEGNQITGSTDLEIKTIEIGKFVRDINVVNNDINHCFYAIYLMNMDSAYIRGNMIKNANYGIYIDDWCTKVEVSANRLINILSQENAQEGTSGILVDNGTGIDVFNNFIHTSGTGPVNGINIQSTSSCRVLYNSLNITNTDNQGKSKGILLKSTHSLKTRNNIFKITGSGTPVYISTGNTLTDCDYNDYYNVDESIGFFNGKIYTDLEAWKDSVGMDMHSLSVTPFYTTATDLSINQAQLNNAGNPVTGIVTDIDGVSRDLLQPDIGAKEYNLCGIDAGINAVVSPENPLFGGVADVRVILQNQGTTALNSVKINWSVNSNLQTAFPWSGNLAAGANTEVSVGDYDFQNGSSFLVKAWASDPNELTDCNNKNDTICSDVLAGSLCGSYTVGGDNPDFGSLAEVAEVLNTAGISCPVTFLVRDGTYFEKLILKEIKGSSIENTITFQSESGDSTHAVLQIDPEALKDESLFYLDKTQHVIFKGLGLFTGSSVSNTNYAMLLTGTSDIEFSGCYFKSINQSDYGLYIQGGSQDVRVKNNRFDCPDYRARAINISGNLTRNVDVVGNIIKGSSTTLGSIMIEIGIAVSNLNITDNDIEQSNRSIYLKGADSIRISRNLIKNSYYGIYVDNLCSHIDISQNRLFNILSLVGAPDGTSGIFVNNSTEVDILNNFVQTSGDGPVVGIDLLNSSSCRAIYNSINTINTDAQGKSKGMYIKSCNEILARNNIFNINNLGIPIHIDAGVTGLNLDYNNYYSPSGIIGKLLTDQVFNNLSEWGQAINGDANSKVVDPYFEADTIPLPFQRILNGAGIPVSGILYDIDGKLRFSQAPDIGCMEFFVDYGILELISPTLNCFHGETDSVIIHIRQFGDVPFNDLKVAYQLNNGPVHTDTIPGPVITDVIHAFSTLENISAPGDYRFRIWLIGTLDDNINNDTLIAMRYSKPPPVITIGYDNFCTGWEVHFTGQATVDAPYTIAGYEWLFGDGDSSLEQNPVHTYLASGTYQVALRAYSSAGCYSETIMPVFIDPGFLGLHLDYDLVTETCLGDGTGSVTLNATGGYPPYSYLIDGMSITGNVLDHLSSGKHVIKVTDSQLCTYTDSIDSYPVVDMNPVIQASPLSGFAPLTVQFDFTADGAADWTWYLFEDVTDTNKTAYFTFNSYGEHTVMLEVQSGPPYNCTDAATIVIFVDIRVTIEPNSVFTPNEDGYNDFFEIKTLGVKELNANIFNQWGNKMYEIDSVNGKWDGTTTGGAKAPDGTYFYSITAKGFDNLNYERKGTVLLLRHGTASYPNPVEGKVNIKIYDPMQGPVSVDVYSVFGQLAHSEVINDPQNIVIDISDLSSGIYIIKVNDGKQDYYARIIKN